MRNSFPGTCYRCNKRVEVGEGHFERFRGGWRTQHASCAIAHRGEPDPARVADTERRRHILAQGTGKSAQRARKYLREQHQDSTSG